VGLFTPASPFAPYPTGFASVRMLGTMHGQFLICQASKSARIPIADRQKPGRTTESQKEPALHLICPGCYAQYELTEHTISQDRPACPNCNLPLLRSEENRKSFKCLRCIHRAIVPDGIWCRRFNTAARPEMARHCRHYASLRRKKALRK
jgi:hypothetical protein